MKKEKTGAGIPYEIDISDADIYEAMKDISGYLDITPADLKEIFRFAYRHATERIAASVRARDIMTTKVHTVRKDTPLNEVAGIMAEKRISGMPVLDEEGKVKGMISEKDFLHHMGAGDAGHVMKIITECLQGKGCLAAPIRQKTAEEIMSTPAITITEDVTLFKIMELFSARGINRVPVVDSNNVLRGIISRADIIRAQVIKAL